MVYYIALGDSQPFLMLQLGQGICLPTLHIAVRGAGERVEDLIRIWGRTDIHKTSISMSPASESIWESFKHKNDQKRLLREVNDACLLIVHLLVTFFMKRCWELGCWHLIWAHQRFAHSILKAFHDADSSLSADNPATHTIALMAGKFFRASNFSFPSWWLTSWLLILSTVEWETSIPSDLWGYVFRRLDSPHSCSASSSHLLGLSLLLFIPTFLMSLTM